MLRARPLDEYLVVYDYGTGGVWALMHALSRAAIETRYPELKVFHERPGWMNDNEYKRIKANWEFASISQTSTGNASTAPDQAVVQLLG